MSDVRLESRLDAPPALALAALGDILRDIAAQRGGWEGFALHVGLGEAGLPDVGYIAIPIALEVDAPKPGIDQFAIRFRAARHPESFPVFEGHFGIDPTGPSSSTFWVAGTYEVPLAGAGRFVDATLLRGVAHKALANLLDDVASAARAAIDKREAEYARYRMFGH
ncbi:MAG: hypothetical protein JO199_00245 [Candidatus Eremiobacteraeota bacterium]|nr:hypothetical protein [Candidatus Eremiobacteraeota bacterium]